MLVTGEALDEEMRNRIAHHRAARGPAWTTIEAPVHLAAAIRALSAEDVAVVDCLTLWLSNIMGAERDLVTDAAELCQAVAVCEANLWLVSNEVGQGIVPDNALARRFVDEAGRLHQHLAVIADEAVLLIAGLPLPLKSGWRQGRGSGERP